MEEKTLEERIYETEKRLEKALNEIATLRSFVSALEKRLDANDRDTGKVLDTTKEIKEILTGTSRDTKSAKRNAKGWGFASVFISLAFKLGEVIFRSKVAL